MSRSCRKRTASTLVIFMGPTASAAARAGSGRTAAPAALRNSLRLLRAGCMAMPLAPQSIHLPPAARRAYTERMLGPKTKYRYDHYTWPEMRQVVARQPVCILPIGSVEDHGRHLPLDVDNFLIGSICDEVARQIPDDVLLLPPIPYGFEDHHMSFPGTITIRPEHLEAFVLDITLSLAHHGFRKILLADGHGSNMPILDLAARKTIIQSEALCACFIWPSLITDLLRKTRESPFPGGMAHACELETSVYLYLNETAVQM